MSKLTVTKPVSNVELITPELAKTYLAMSTGNRSVNGEIKMHKSQIDFLKSIILRNEWVITPSGVAFDVTGRLIDAHHRLQAIIEAGVPVYMMVTRGMPVDSYSGIDTGGRLRSPSEILGVSRSATEVLRIGLQFAYNDTAHKATIGEIEKCMGSRLIEVHDELMAVCPTCRRGLTKAPIRLGVCTNLLRATDEGEFDYIFSQYRAAVLGYKDEMSNVVFNLREYHADSPNVRKRGVEYRFSAYVRSVMSFDPTNRHAAKIVMRDSTYDAIMAEAVELYSEVLLGKKESRNATGDRPRN